MTPEQLKFINTWLLSEEEFNRRHNLIIEDIDQFKNTSVFARKVLLKSAYKILVSQCKFMATLKPITDSELMNFLQGVFTLPIYYKEQDDKLGEQIDQLMQPATGKFSKYLTSKEFQRILIDQEVSGDEILKVGDVEVKLTNKEVLLHIERTKSLPLISEDIRKIQKDLVDYKRKLYLDEKARSLDKIKQFADKIELFKQNVGPYGFFKLSKVAELSSEGQVQLMDLLVNNAFPYSVAMLDHFGFLTHLIQNHFKKKGDRDKELSNWFGVAERVVRGNINALNNTTAENRARYTSYHYKETVKKDYENIKKEYALKLP